MKQLLPRSGSVVLASLFAWACGATVQEGVSVEVAATTEPLLRDAAFETEAGYQVRVDGAWVTNAEVELEPCEGALSALWDWVVPQAHAHGTSTPTLLADPVVQALLPGGEVVLGALAPPAGTYCSVRYRVDVADSDAAGLDAAPELVGLSLLVRGSFRLPEQDWEDFEITSSNAFEVERAPLTLSLGARQRTARVTIRQDPSAWLDSLEFLGSSPQQWEEALRLGAQAAVRIDVE